MKIFRILGKRGRVTIPFAIRQQMSFSHDDVLSFTPSQDGQSVLIVKEQLCSACDCGVDDSNYFEPDELTLLEYLDTLSVEQQREALIHLSVRWAEQAKEAE